MVFVNKYSKTIKRVNCRLLSICPQKSPQSARHAVLADPDHMGLAYGRRGNIDYPLLKEPNMLTG